MILALPVGAFLPQQQCRQSLACSAAGLGAMALRHMTGCLRSECFRMDTLQTSSGRKQQLHSPLPCAALAVDGNGFDYPFWSMRASRRCLGRCRALRWVIRPRQLACTPVLNRTRRQSAGSAVRRSNSSRSQQQQQQQHAALH